MLVWPEQTAGMRLAGERCMVEGRKGAGEASWGTGHQLWEATREHSLPCKDVSKINRRRGDAFPGNTSQEARGAAWEKEGSAKWEQSETRESELSS